MRCLVPLFSIVLFWCAVCLRLVCGLFALCLRSDLVFLDLWVCSVRPGYGLLLVFLLWSFAVCLRWGRVLFALCLRGVSFFFSLLFRCVLFGSGLLSGFAVLLFVADLFWGLFRSVVRVLVVVLLG